jgi:hypothetical protein
MNFFIVLLTNLYAKLLHLYPVRFRAEFAQEMQVVFRDSLKDAIKDGLRPLIILCLREYGGLPFNLIREFWHELQRKETRMLDENTVPSPENSATAAQAIMGSLPFLVFGLFLILIEIPIDWKLPAWFDTFAGVIFVSLLILPAIGFGIGWVQKFPRWSYPYAGMAFVMALYIANVTTPGLNILGYPIFGREPWGLRAGIPLAIALIAALAISRSFQPFVKLFTNVWEDWSILSYLMVGLLPLLIAFQFDEIDRLYSLYFMVPFAVLLVGMVLLYLRSESTWQQVLVLTIGVIAIIFPSVLGSNSYWLDHNGMHLSGASRMLILAGKIALIMLVPAWLELLRRSVSRLRTT